MDLLDVCERAENGPLMTEKDFELKVFIPKLNAAVKKYEVVYDSETPVPADNDLADRIYQAALEFFVQVGVYCQDTNRIIQFSEEEVLRTVKNARGRCYVGEGQDASVFDCRLPDDPKMARCHVNWGTNQNKDVVSHHI